MNSENVTVKLNRQQLELLDNTSKNHFKDKSRVEVLLMALRDYCAKHGIGG
ncbi:hypothetical protein CDEF62S_04102 [Castellaniella defragrans]